MPFIVIEVIDGLFGFRCYLFEKRMRAIDRLNLPGKQESRSLSRACSFSPMWLISYFRVSSSQRCDSELLSLLEISCRRSSE